MSQPSAILEVSGLVKDFHDFWGRPFIRAVAGLDLSLRKGEVFGLLGPNGSGKTTTIKMLLGLLEPTSGVISLLGGSPGDPSIRRRIGYLPEENVLFRHQRSEDELRLAGRFYGLRGEVLEGRVESLLRRAGIYPARGRYLREFSKGMGRRHGLARALMGDPEMLILDEPTSGLDPMGVRQVKDLILELKGQGKTILLSSHLLADVEEVCDRVVIIYLGRKVIEGRLEELLAAPGGTEVTVHGKSPEEVNAKAGALRDLLGADIHVEPRKMRLEELFVSVVKGKRDGDKRD